VSDAGHQSIALAWGADLPFSSVHQGIGDESAEQSLRRQAEPGRRLAAAEGHRGLLLQRHRALPFSAVEAVKPREGRSSYASTAAWFSARPPCEHPRRWRTHVGRVRPEPALQVRTIASRLSAAISAMKRRRSDLRPCVGSYDHGRGQGITKKPSRLSQGQGSQRDTWRI
jgi:hypothetical protein